MTTTDPTIACSLDEILREACGRNTPAELHYESTTGDRSISRVRMLAVTETQILTDVPHKRPGDTTIPLHRLIAVHFVFDGMRRQFKSVIVADGLDVRLNDQKTIRGIALLKPHCIEDSQRRSDFRLSVAANHPIPVLMVVTHPDTTEACLLDEPRPTGQIVDISVGGVSVLVESQLMPKKKMSTPHFLCFSLPGADKPFDMLAVARHVRELHQGESLRVGWMFKEWGWATLHGDQRRIARFVTEQQRRLIHQRK